MVVAEDRQIITVLEILLYSTATLTGVQSPPNHRLPSETALA